MKYTTYYTSELYHYGVIGMKWGVRHNRAKAVENSYKKYNKLKAKSNKYQLKGTKKLARPLTDFSTRRGFRLLRKSAKLNQRAEKWAAKSMKVLYGEKISRLERKSGMVGQRFVAKAQNELYDDFAEAMSVIEED